jgi:isopenicillin-N N-acyltransferase like protein
MMIRVLDLDGDAYQMGRQHGEQISDLHPQLQASMRARLADLGLSCDRVADYKEEIVQIWKRYASNTLAMLSGIAEALQMEWEEYFTYIVAYYLKTRIENRGQGEGCTTWAASADFTQINETLLAKNREENPDLQPLQCLARVRPTHGHAYLCLTSAGNPGVSSSGVNAAGLAVADTYVVSLDTGPGVPRYSFLATLLENCSSVEESIHYLFSIPHVGDGTVILADAKGEMAVFEIAHSVQVVRRSEQGFIVSTNHFSEKETRSSWVDEEPTYLQGNSIERRKQVETSLSRGRGLVGIEWSKALMAQHGSDLSAICRHPETDRKSHTLSSAIYLPEQGKLYLANGLPCQTPFEEYELNT